MEIYEKNREVIKKWYPEILKEMDTEASEEYKVESIEARDGNPALLVEKDGKKYRLNSAYRPVKEAEKWAEQFALQNIEVHIFMFGFGNGIFIRELLNRMMKDANIYVWEPDVSIFNVIVKDTDVADIIDEERFHLYLGEKGLKELKEVMLRRVNWTNLPTQIRCSHIGYDKLYEKEYQLFREALYYVNQMSTVTRNTNAHFAHRSVVNTIQNLRYMRHSNYITELIGKIPEGIPAIIVAAGPSLDKNMALLRKAQGKSLIIATDTALRVLEKNGMPYDCIITVDPAKPASYFTSCPGCKEKPLFCVTQGEKGILKFHTGRKIWGSGALYLEWLYLLFGMYFPETDLGGSVATSATLTAFQLGIKDIILIGQDLAYGETHTHAGGVNSHIRNEGQYVQMVDGIDGREVKTRGDWIIYRDWYEEFIKKHGDLNLIDATEGGALIHGSTVMTFEEAIETYCEGKEFSFEQMLDALPATFENRDFTPFEEKIRQMERGFQNIARKSREGKKDAEDFLASERNMSPKKHDRILKSLKKANSYIGRQEGYDLLDMYSNGLTVNELKDVYQVTGEAETDEINVVKGILSLYDGLLEGVSNLEELLHTTLQEL